MKKGYCRQTYGYKSGSYKCSENSVSKFSDMKYRNVGFAESIWI